MIKEKISRPDIIPLLPGKLLTCTGDIGCFMYDIKHLVSCSEKMYQTLYRATLWHVAEFCQAMPYSETEFNWDNGFLLRQLSLAVAALKLRRGFLFPKNAGAESIAAEEAQWTYAIFSGSLIKNLYQLEENRVVNCYQLQGDLVRTWSPTNGSLYKKYFYYNMRFDTKESFTKRDVLMAAISQYIFPIEVIRWLSTNTDLFKLWWDVVLHQASLNNEVEAIIQLAGNKLGMQL